MFDLSLRSARVGLRSQEEADAIILGLKAKGYRPIVRSMLAAGFEVAGLKPDPTQFQEIVGDNYTVSSDTPIAELFIGEDELYLLDPSSDGLHVCSIRYHETPSKIAGFCDALVDVMGATIDGRRRRGMDFDWKEEEPDLSPEEFSSEILTSKEPNYSEQDAKRAEILSSLDHRNFLLRLARVSGKARSTDTLDGVGAMVVQPLLAAGLMSKEYLVVCRQDSHIICNVPERERLSAAGDGLKCTICGRPLADELMQEIYAISDAGTNLLNGSRWMTIWMTELLKAGGLSPQRIKWASTAAEDEIDIVADLYGRKIFFELKDKEFGGGDASKFLLRLERFGGSFGVVASTVSVADEVKKIFKERRERRRSEDAPIVTIGSAENIRTRLADIVDRFSRRTVYALLSRHDFGFQLGPIVYQWMNSNSHRPRLDDQ